MRRTFLTLATLSAVVLAAGAYLWQSMPVVSVQPATTGDVAEAVYATGVVEPVEWAKVVPIVRGRLVEVCGPCEGRPVRRGDVLARLDDSEARAQTREIEARLSLAERTLERLQDLRTRGVSTVEAVDRATAEVSQLRALLAAQRERVENLVLRSPQDGIVLRRDFQVGEVVSTSDVVAWVGRPHPLRIVAEVAEEDIGGVRPGLKVLLRHEAFRTRVLGATVESITPKGDPVQKTFRVHLALPDDTPLRVGMSVEANIIVDERRGVVVVPADSVRNNRVFLRGANGRVEARPVTVGLRGTTGFEITGGIAAGTPVISPLPADLTEGSWTRTAGESPLTLLGRSR